MNVPAAPVRKTFAPKRANPGRSPEALAKHAILLLENALRDEFGVDVHAGVELECSYKIPPALQETLIKAPHPYTDLLFGHKRVSSAGYAPARNRRGQGPMDDKHALAVNLTKLAIEPPPGACTSALDSTEMVQYQKSRHQALRAAGLCTPGQLVLSKSIAGDTIGHLMVTDSLFPNSRWVSNSYREVNQAINDWYQYEHVISHEAPHDAIPLGQGRFVALAKATEALRKTIASTPAQRKTFADDPVHNAWLNHVAHGIVERSTEAQLGTMCDQGMHINLSVTHKGEPILHGAMPDAGNAQAHMIDLLLDGFYLLLPSEKAVHRAWTLRNRFEFMPFQRVEITHPSAESNPYYAMMLSLASVYHGLKSEHFSKEAGGFYPPSPTCPRYDEIIGASEGRAFVDASKERFFHGEHLLRNVLNDLEPQLGNHFESAIAKTPPGHEKPPHEAGIVGPGIPPGPAHGR